MLRSGKSVVMVLLHSLKQCRFNSLRELLLLSGEVHTWREVEGRSAGVFYHLYIQVFRVIKRCVLNSLFRIISFEIKISI